MSLLAPLFLIGGLALVAPIIAHLVRRATKERIQFSATRFLEPSVPRLSRRSRIENPWLLLLRCLVILALAFGFARPFLSEDSPVLPATRMPRHVVAVLDESASMQRSDLTAQAHARLGELVGDLQPEDHFALVSTDDRARTLLSAELWNATAAHERENVLEAVLSERNAGWGSTRLDTAVEAALDEIEAMSETAGGSTGSEIVVISDFAESARVSNLAGRDWPVGCTVTLSQVSISGRHNAAVQAFGWTTTPGGTRAARLRLSHDGSGISPVQLTLRDAATDAAIGDARTETLAPMETRIVVLDVPRGAPAALRVDLEGDDEPFDNTAWLVAPQTRRVTVTLLGADTGDDTGHALFYLSRALEGSRDLEIAVEAIDPLSSMSLPDSPLFVVNSPLSEAMTATLRERIQAGATALVIASTPELVSTAGILSGETAWVAGKYARADAILGEIDFTHPLFALFADPRFSDFTRVRFWKPVPINLPESSQTRIIARFEDRSPAVVATIVGAGSVIAWGGDWTPNAGQWVLSSKFVPWLQNLLVQAMGGPVKADSIEFDALTHSTEDESTRWTPIASAEHPTATTIRADSPGIYEVGEGGRTHLVAVQVPAGESRTGTLSLETWEQLAVPLKGEAIRGARPVKSGPGHRESEILENEQKLWRWLLFAAALLLVIESMAAIRASQRRATAAATA